MLAHIYKEDAMDILCELSDMQGLETFQYFNDFIAEMMKLFA